MIPQEIIRKKRDKKVLLKEEISLFVKGLTDGSFSDSQVAAMSMAIFLNGMIPEETVNLTEAMTTSGDTINWAGVVDTDLVCDKHSTGGVGDKTSLILAPILAACGLFVPMISGRGLGHTGGTLDKFDSIPGYNTQPDLDTFKKVVKEVGCAIIPNFSVGMVLLQQAASVAAKFYDNIELIEMHHNQKADSPSGTCIKTAEMIEEYPKKCLSVLIF